MSRGKYLGSGLSLVDDKGRLAIPASLRGTLLANTPGIEGKGGGTIFVGVHQEAKCLVAFDPGYVDRLADELDRRERENTREGGAVDYNIKRCGGMGGEGMPFDSSGRFVLPGFPRFHAGIKGHAFFWGTIDLIEIWDPATLLDTADMPDVMQSACRYHMMDKKVAL